MKTDQILVVEDDRSVREALGQTLELADLYPILCGSFVEAKDHISERFLGVVLTDIRMPGRDGFHVLGFARGVDPDLPVVLLTGEGDIPMAVRAMSEGAFGFLEKPCAPTDLVAVLTDALAQRDSVLTTRQHRLQQQSGDAAERMLFGDSQQAQDLRTQVRNVARTGAEVLVFGDPGSGTPKVAEVIHLLSQSAHHPFVKRAGAGLDVPGLLQATEQTGQGTLYIDEVAGLAPAVQFALLECLEQRANFRVLAGSTRDLAADMEQGRFNPDLFYRLDMMRVRIPALRERPQDIPVLFRHYVAQACEQANLAQPDIPPDYLTGLMGQDWPGNARALMNQAMRFAMGVETDARRHDLGLAEQMAEVEKSILKDALRRAGGRAVIAAEALKLPRKTFYDRLTRYGIKPEEFR